MPSTSDGSPSSFADRIQRLVDESGGSREFARRVGVSETMVRKWRGGADATRETLVSIARVLGVRLEWLATGEGPMRGKVHYVSGFAKVHPLRELPWVEGEPEAWDTIPPEGLTALGIRLEDLVLVRARGDSMAPTIRDGDRLYVDRGEAGRTISDGRLYLMRAGGELMVRKLVRDPDGSIKAIAENPVHGATRVFDVDERAAASIIGRVIHIAGSR